MSSSQTEYDVIIAGAGASGMVAALTARSAGLSVLVLEKSEVVGGTSALSGGWIWAPCNRYAQEMGLSDTMEAAHAYIRSEAGQHYDEARVTAYLQAINPTLDFLEGTGWFDFFLGSIPDYRHPEAGTVLKGRSLCCRPFSTRKMKGRETLLREPLKALKFFGIPIASGPELWHFLNALRAPASALFVARVIGKDILDRLRFGRSTRLVNGNSLMARLLMACDAAGVGICLNTPVTALLRDDSGRVTGVRCGQGSSERSLVARRGVVLAAGGFPQDIARRARVYAHHPGSTGHLSMAPAGNVGDGLALAQLAGAELHEDYAIPAAWFPVSPIDPAHPEGARFIHFLDRGKPGVLAVTPAGHRFVDEGSSYGDFVEAMIAAGEGDQPRRAWLIADQAAMRRYGLGYAKPWPMPRRALLRSGYLRKGRSIAALAGKIGIHPEVLEATINRFNAFAKVGKDEDFHRGEGSISRYNGDVTRQGHPSLAPLTQGPFWAVEVFTGDIGTFAGIAADAGGRVKAAGGGVIPGLYAVGNDQASVFGGAYPGAGATLGPAIAFGHIVGRKLAENG